MQEVSLVLLLVSAVSIVVIVGLVLFIGIVVMRLLSLFTSVNKSSQSMQKDIRKLLHKASGLTSEETEALSRSYIDHKDRDR